jgi:dihydrofolate reductase
MQISIIVAVANNNVIGLNNQMLWHLPADLKRFKNLTMGHHIIMGRKTYESIGKPLIGRKSIIITHNQNYKAENCLIVNNINEALNIGYENNENEIFIIGGAQIFNQTLNLADKIYLTKIYENFDGDTFFPNIDLKKWELISQEHFLKDEKNKFDYSFVCYNKIIM